MSFYINGDHNSVSVVHGDVIHGDVIYGADYGPPARPPIGFFGLFVLGALLAWVIVKFWWIVLIVVGVAAVAFGTWLEREEKRRVGLEKKRREAALKARAESQNSAYLRGDPQGVYGDFPPPPGVGL